jgi:hypothetical protein
MKKKNYLNLLFNFIGVKLRYLDKELFYNFNIYLNNINK